MTIDAPRCPALHPDLPYARCVRREGHGTHHATITGLEWDDTAHMAALWKETARREFQYRVLARTGREFYRGVARKLEESRDAAVQERDEARARLAEAAKEIREQGETIAELAAEPRPLTADAIETVLHDILPLTTERLGADDIANIAFDLHAALTEPPRLEGAEEIEALIDRAGIEGEGADNESLADYLTRCGVRVVGEKDHR